MMLPLCTSVTETRSFSMAYWIALRIRRWLPSFDTGLMPMPELAGKRMPVTFSSFCRKAMRRCTSAEPAGHSMPA